MTASACIESGPKQKSEESEERERENEKVIDEREREREREKGKEERILSFFFDFDIFFFTSDIPSLRCQRRIVECVNALIKHGADVTAKNVRSEKACESDSHSLSISPPNSLTHTLYFSSLSLISHLWQSHQLLHPKVTAHTQ